MRSGPKGRRNKGAVMQNSNHYDAYHYNTAYTDDNQYDAYMYDEYGIER